MGVCLGTKRIRFEDEDGFEDYEMSPESMVRGAVVDEGLVDETAMEDIAQKHYKKAKIYEQGNSKVEKNPGKAAEHFGKAAELGHVKAQIRLAYLYEKGIGVEKDTRLAVQWYKKAADSDPKAQFSLGLCYTKGVGTSQDHKKAVEYFKRSAESGYDRALYNLGYCYEQGTGVHRNIDTAIRYYIDASSQGNEHAKKRLELFGVDVPV